MTLKYARKVLLRKLAELNAGKEILDFVIATDFPYDNDFVSLLKLAAYKLDLTFKVVLPENLDATFNALVAGDSEIGFFYDRASDTSPEFIKLHNFMIKHNIPIFENQDHMAFASDKATMHLEFIAHGLITPYTIIIPPFSTAENIFLSVADLAKLGRPFFIKPANTTGGGIGVVDGAETLQDILHARKVYKSDKYLLQRKVVPVEKDGKRFWFRCFYTCGLVQCAWWHDQTHIYEPLTLEAVRHFNLQPLFDIVPKIAPICGLNFFSTEIALTSEGTFVVVDYVNEICDMRLKSQHTDGVPDEIAAQVADKIIAHARQRITKFPKNETTGPLESL